MKYFGTDGFRGEANVAFSEACMNELLQVMREQGLCEQN